MAQIQIEIAPNKWLSELSKKFPNLRFNILSMFLTPKEVRNILIHLQGDNISPPFPILNSYQSILEHYIVSKMPTTILLNVKMWNPWMLISSIEDELLLK